jgi:hypothetical protein
VKPSVEDIGTLLALKRHERPEEGFLDDFLRDFHQRRRQEEALKEGPAGWWHRMTSWASEVGTSKWLYGAGLAYAAAAALFLLSPNPVQVQPAPPVPAAYQVEPAESVPVQQLDAIDLRPTSKGTTGEQEF